MRAMAAIDVFDSPFGPIVIAATAKGISHVVLKPTRREIKGASLPCGTGIPSASLRTSLPVSERSQDGRVTRPGQPNPAARKALAHVRQLREELTRYFAGEAFAFDVPFDLSGGTVFQRAIWRACARIPHGQTRSYAEVARMAGRPAAARATGNALHNNPVPIVVPCHRVIKSDGSLGGFGGGVSLKKGLLRLGGSVWRG